MFDVYRVAALLVPALTCACLLGSPADATTVKVYSSTGVMDANGVTPLQGSGLGSASSDQIQVLYAGPNASIQPPDISGLPTGDDELLEVSGMPGQLFTAVGEGFPFNPNEGKFIDDFLHALNAGAKIYVRAWNSPSIGVGAKYGDSALYTITNEPPSEQHDFGTWLTNKEVQQLLPWSDGLGILLLGLALVAVVVFQLRRIRSA